MTMPCACPGPAVTGRRRYPGPPRPDRPSGPLFVPFASEPLGSLLDAEQALAHHERVADLHQDQLDDDAGAAPRVAAAQPGDEPCAPGAVRLQQPQPAAAGLGPQHQPAGLQPGHPPARRGGGLGAHGHPVADAEILELRQDLPGARPAEIVQQVIAVKAGPVPAPLHQPGPDLLRPGSDRDGASGVQLRMRAQLVAGHRTGDLIAGGTPAEHAGPHPAKVPAHRSSHHQAGSRSGSARAPPASRPGRLGPGRVPGWSVPAAGAAVIRMPGSPRRGTG